MAVATSTMIALAAAAAASGASYYNTQQTAKRQDNSAADAIRNQAGKQQTADAKIAELIKQTADSRPDDERQQQMDSYLATLKAGAQKQGINQGVGGFSDEYRQDAATTAQGVDQFGVDRAGLLARMDAPILQRQNEGLLFNSATSDLNFLDREAKQQGFLDQLKLNAVQRNPWIDAFSQAAGSYAGASGGGGWGATAAPASGASSTYFSNPYMSGLGTHGDFRY